MKRSVVRALGWLAILHGLSHAVLPLRGSLAPAIAIGDWTPVLFYTVSLIGFVIAGLGLLGLRPLAGAISPLLVLSSGLSIVAIQRLGHPDLWPGAAFDIAFFLLGLWRASAGWPAFARPLVVRELWRGRLVEGDERGRVWHVLGLVFGFAFLGYIATVTMLWPWHRTWGTTRAEVAMSLPGDRPTRNPAIETQHAVTIEAPPGDVWPVVERLASDRGWNTTLLHRESAMAFADGRALVLLPAEGGRTRLVVRKTIGRPSMTAWAAVVDFVALELPHFVTERRMMLAVKALAEQNFIRIALSQ